MNVTKGINDLVEDLIAELSKKKCLSLNEEDEKKEKPIKIQRNLDFIRHIIENETTSWGYINFEKNVEFVKLETYDQEFLQISSLFFNSFKPTNKADILNIYRVQNPYLLSAYLLKKEETKIKFGTVREELLFHGTTDANATSICTNNFDWRLRGKSKGHIFGQGVSFSPIAYYSAWSCDQSATIKTILVAKVLIAKSTCGNPLTVIPPMGYDTTQKPNGHVIVKYDDNTFYPAYKIEFKLNGRLMRSKNRRVLSIFDI